jgi:hypothetical protein
MRRNVALAHLAQSAAVGSLLEWVLAAEEDNMEAPQGAMAPANSQHYRELASKLREIARHCRFPGARREILDLAFRYEGRADHFEARNSAAGSAEDAG